MLQRVAVVVLSGALLAPCVPHTARADASVDGEILQEVIVSAEKRTTNLQKTAAGITAIPADTLLDAGVSDLREAQKLVPSVGFRAEGNNTQVFVRGVGANLDQANVEPNVAVNFAGVYLPREATSAAFFDVQQLEILPGTQGTLYGRSAIGGTINLTPTRPKFDNEGRTLLEVGNYSAVHATVTQDVKAAESVALRAAVDYAYNNGFEATGSNSKNDVSLRLSAIIQPAEQLSAYLWVQGAQKDGHLANLVNKGLNPATGTYCEPCFLYPNDPWNDTRTGAFATPFGTPRAESSHYRTGMLGGQIDYEFDDMVLSYLPSYLYFDAKPLSWLSAIQWTNTAHYNQVTQELRLSNKGGGRVNWLGGLYYYNSRNNGTLTLFTNQPFAFYQSNVLANRLQGYAAFGQATLSITDSLRLTGGGRISSTKRTAHGAEVVALGGLPYSFDKTYNHVDWKAGVEQDVSQQIMLYGTVQTGYQPGTFNELPNTATFDNEVKPERLTSYTVGIKSRWFDDRLQVNDEVYYYDFRNLLIQSYNISAPYNTIFNAGKVAIKGDQLDILARVFVRDELNASVGYSHARNVDFITPSGASYNGLQPAYAPDWTFNVAYTHNVPLGTAMLRAYIAWRYESSWFADYVHNKGTRQGGAGKGDATLTYDASRWSVGAWVKNMTNRATIAATAASGVPGPATAYLGDPRTFGLRFTVSY
jgi:iron complex outermembrane receptor protein